MKRHCDRCKTEFDYPPVVFDGRQVFVPPLCPACQAAEVCARERARSERDYAERLTAWKALCPASFEDMDLALLPSTALLVRMIDWKPGPRGLLIHGETGRGKTRCAWLLLAREFFRGRSVMAVTATDVATYPSRMISDSAGAARWLHRAIRVDLLLLDDVFKARPTEQTEVSLFCVIDERTAHGRPIIVTTNDTGATLEARLSQDRGAPMIRRLREFCEDVPA